MIKITIAVSQPSVVYSAGFRYLLIYRSTSENGTYTQLAGGYVALTTTDTTYTYNDATGTTDNWYKTRYADQTTEGASTLLSSLSAAVQGDEDAAEICFDITYPDEMCLSATEEILVSRIRVLIGDQKELVRDYVAECYSSVHDDGHTYELSQKGWPVYISLDNVVYSNRLDPCVSGWRYVTFSGTISTVTGTLDVYFETFRWADSEILTHYTNALIPPGLTPSTVTTDHMIIQTAIDLLEAENWRDYIENGAILTDSDTKWDPTPGYRARESAIGRLQKRLDDLVKQYMLYRDGWRVD